MTNDKDSDIDGEEEQNKQLMAWFKTTLISLLARIKATVDQSISEISPQLSGALSSVRIPAGAIKPLALAAVIVLSAVALPAAPFGGGMEGLNGTTSDPVVGQTYEDLGDSEFRQVVTSRVGSSQADAPPAPSEVRTSAGSQTMQIETTVRDGDPAIVLEDDRTHDGRWVSIDASWFEEHVGEVPRQAQIDHETDGSYSTPIEVRGESAAFYVQGFSTNTVTFDGRLSVSASPAVDGDTISYDSPSGGENLAANVTGVDNQQSRTISGSVSGSTTDTVEIGGTTDPVSTTITPTFVNATGSYSESSLGLSDGQTKTVSVSEDYITHVSIDQFTPDTGDGERVDVSIYLDDVLIGTEESVLVASTRTTSFSGFSHPVSGGSVDIRIETYSSDSGTNYDSDFKAYSMTGETPPDSLDLTDPTGTTQTLSDGETTNINLSQGSNSVDFSLNGGGSSNYDINATEVTETVDPTLNINGNSAGHSGTLNDGETVSLAVNDSWIQDGTNEVGVSLGSVNIGPQSKAKIDIKHDIPESRTIAYSAEAFSERYSTSKTWSENTSNATLTIPWASSNVIAVRDVSVEYSEGGTELTTHPTPSYTLNNNELTVDLGDVESGWNTTVSADGSKVQVSGADLEVLNATDQGQDLNTDIRLNNPSDDVYLRVGATDQGQQLHYLANASWSNEESSQISADGTNEMRIPGAPDNGEAEIRTLPLAFNVGTGNIDVDIPDDRVNEQEPVYRIGPGSSSGDSYDVTFVDAADSQSYVLWDETDEIVLDSGTASSPLTLSTTDPDSTHILQFREDDGTASGSGSGSSSGGIGPMVTTSSPFSGLSGLLPGRMTVLLALAGLVGLSVVARTTPLFNEGTRSDAVADATTDVAKRAGGLIERAFDNEIVLAALTLGGGVWLLTSGAFTASERLIISLGSVPIAMFLVLQQFDQFDIRIWVGSTAVVGVLGLQQLAPEVFVTVADEAGIIIAVGAIALGWRALSAYRAEASTPDEVNRIEIRGDSDD